MLPYPQRFEAAVEVVAGLPAGEWLFFFGFFQFRARSPSATDPLPHSPLPTHPDALSDDAILALYALHNQATRGPCSEPRPWAWDGGAAARWSAWKELGAMPPTEAMRLYVRVLDDEVPGWWEEVEEASPVSSRPASSARRDDENGGVPPLCEWRSLALDSASDAGPCPRYEHGAVVVGASLLIAGGAASGRTLGDTWRLDLATLRWARAAPRAGEPGAFPPRAGATLVEAGGVVLAIGGRQPRSGGGGPPTEAETWAWTPTTERWARLPTGGDPPPPLHGHAAVAIGPRVFVVGGDTPRGASSDAFVLDTRSHVWRKARARGPSPTPRAGAAAAAVGRFVVVVGGADGATVHSSVAVLDTEALEWVTPTVAGSPLPPRAGGGAARVGAAVIIAGGGDLGAPVADTVALDCAALPRGPLTWRVVARASARDAAPAASEGLALVRVPGARALLAFGGNVGRLHARLAVLRLPPPSESEGASEEDEASETAAAAGAPPPPMPTSTDGGPVLPSPARPPPPPNAAAVELALMRRQLASAQAVAADAAARADALEAALERARALVASLEVAAADGARAAAAVDELRAELDHFKRKAGGGGNDASTPPKRVGLWAFVSGAS